jgi:carboxypeptidase Taq
LVNATAYSTLTQTRARIYRLGHLQALAGWDSAAMMPRKGQQARADAMAEMDALLHRMGTDPALAALIEQAQGETLTDWQRANLREIEREWRLASAVPEALVQAQSLAAARCEHAWRTQRQANDWRGFLDNFREVLRLAREEAQRRADLNGLHPYDALLDKFEPGMTGAELDRLFDEVQSWLPNLVRDVQQRQSREPRVEPVGPFATSAQRELCLEVMQWLGFDFDAGRLDESSHPFSGGVPEDIRMTTRYRDDDFVPSLMGTIHETGHARYEQNLPRDWLGQPVAQARSMAIHESQSLSFEMQIGRSRGFVGRLAPRLAARFGAQPAFEPEPLYRLLTRVQPGFIRVDADEVTYPAHVILRYRIERALIEGAARAEDIPALWDEAMRAMLGVATQGNFKDGCLQDMHWSEGVFGYFPCYTLGAMYAAQWFAAIRRGVPDLDARIAQADFTPVFDWLRDHVWSQGSRWSTRELVMRASGEPLNALHFRRHLESRYLA